ncbi:MAG: hypothetical protein EOO04_04940 [Chitinophagaceae bacterium]|nr:MAG: hypothetical protein EOO04_04940 [Chitinophagaceae bacterium]
MIEVFRTNVHDSFYAAIIIDHIQCRYPDYRTNFDLDDCDRILRICCVHAVDIQAVIQLVDELGFSASVLEDEPVQTHSLRL